MAETIPAVIMIIDRRFCREIRFSKSKSVTPIVIITIAINNRELMGLIFIVFSNL
jgi:hypothetical protein